MDQISKNESMWRSLGIWMAMLIVGLMFLNATRAWFDPQGFAAYFGLPGVADASPAFVQVYASRALFLALVTAALLVFRQYRALALFAAVAVVMPLADAAQVYLAGDPAGKLWRHVLIAAYLIATAYFLHRWGKNHG
jgi:Domain of unknown function (DUF4267)